MTSFNKVISHIQDHDKNHFFFNFTKKKAQKTADLLKQNVFSNKVNQPGRCHNR